MPLVNNVIILLLCCSCAIGKSVLKTEDEPLMLTPLIENGEVDSARNLSKVDPSLFAGVASHTGFITINKTTSSHLFFWFFPAPDLPLETTPWIIWLQGGPGGSSLFGLFTELGPIQIVNGSAQRMPVTWGSNYSLLFIDNPVGCGFSFTEKEGYARNEDDVGRGLLNFIQQFLEVFPELRKAPLFVTGESYAGKYIPAFGHYIHNYKNESQPINLKGLAIGNGWTDPITLLQYSKFGLQVGLLDPEQAKEIESVEDSARKYYEEGDMESFGEAVSLATTLIMNNTANMYNYIDDEKIKKEYLYFLERKDVRKALHVAQVQFDDSNHDVYNYLASDVYLSVKDWLEELLEHYGVMCYSGQLDVLVAYAMSVNTYRSLRWSGADGYKKAKRIKLYEEYNADKRINSFVKQYGNFLDVMVRSSGHMVPYDQPRAAKQIIDVFIDQFK